MGDGRRARYAKQKGNSLRLAMTRFCKRCPNWRVAEAVFAEPAAAAAYAGLLKAVRAQKIDRDETVVVVITGNGLKDIPSAVRGDRQGAGD